MKQFLGQIPSVGKDFAERAGGYTRIRRTTIRKGDVAQVVVLSYVENRSKVKDKDVEAKKPAKPRQKKVSSAKAKE